MNRSETISKLAVALVKFNSEVSSISKDSKNPFFKSEYVSLDKLILATREILQKNGLSVLQMPLSQENKVGVQTLLLHESGEFIESEALYMTPSKQNDPQAAGSIVTYLRRYSYQAILNLNTGEDDDANKASDKTYKDNIKGLKEVAATNNLTEKQIKRLIAIALSVGVKEVDILKVAKHDYNKDSLVELSKEEYDTICKRLEEKAKIIKQ